jgi:hypothetical protein
VPAGEKIGFKVVPVMHQNDASDIEILVGGNAGSRANWTEAPIALDLLTLTGDRYEGELAGSAYAGDAAPATTRHRALIKTEVAPTVMLVWMNTTDHTGVPDIDLTLVGPDGVEIASSGTPTPREFIRVAGPNLRGPGDYTIVVASYGSARATFSVEWQAG